MKTGRGNRNGLSFKRKSEVDSIIASHILLARFLWESYTLATLEDGICDLHPKWPCTQLEIGNSIISQRRKGC